MTSAKRSQFIESAPFSSMQRNAANSRTSVIDSGTHARHCRPEGSTTANKTSTEESVPEDARSSGTYAISTLEAERSSLRPRSVPPGHSIPPEGGVPPEQKVEAWCDCSEAYGVFADAVSGPFAKDAARLVRIHRGAQVLDVAAGTGAFTFAAAERGADVLATDFSPRMLRALDKNCEERQLNTVRTANMDGMNLDLPDNSFDVAASLFGLMFFSDHQRGLSELFRVTKPGGKAIVTTWALPARVELMRLIGETAMMAEIEVASESEPTWLELASKRELQRRFTQFGFKNAHVVSLTHVWILERAELFADFLPLMTPSSNALFGGMTTEERARFRQTLVEGFHQRQGDGPYAVTSEGLIAVGTKPH